MRVELMDFCKWNDMVLFQIHARYWTLHYQVEQTISRIWLKWTCPLLFHWWAERKEEEKWGKKQSFKGVTTEFNSITYSQICWHLKQDKHYIMFTPILFNCCYNILTLFSWIFLTILCNYRVIFCSTLKEGWNVLVYYTPCCSQIATPLLHLWKH